MYYFRNKTVKLLVLAGAVTLILLGSFGVNQAAGEDKKPTVTLVWEKQMDMEYNFFKQYEYDQLAESYFKAQERILLGQVGEKENVIVVVPNQEVRFADQQGNVVKRIPLIWDQNLTEQGKVGTAYLSPEGKYVGIDFFNSTDDTSTFELWDAAGNLLWQKKLESGIFDKVFITQGANNVMLFITNNGDSDTPPDTLQFFSKDGTLLKEYTKRSFGINKKEIEMDKQEKINVILEKGHKPFFYSRLNSDGSLIWEKDISGFTKEIEVSSSGNYYLLTKKEGNEIYDYLFDKEGVLLRKILVSESSWLSSDGDFYITDTNKIIQFIPLVSGTPSITIDSRRLPGEEKTNTGRSSISLHSSGSYVLLALVKEKDGAPGWVVILDSNNKKVYQNTFPLGKVKAIFSENGKFIRVFNYAESKIMLYKFDY